MANAAGIFEGSCPSTASYPEPHSNPRRTDRPEGEQMPTKETTPLRSSRRRASRTPSKRLVALPGGASKQPASRPAAVAARLRPKRSRTRGKPGFPASLGKAIGDLTSRLSRELSRGAGKKRLAAVLTGAAGALAASVAFVRRRGRRAEPPATEPTPQTTAATIPQQEGDGEPASDTTSAPTTPPHLEGPS
jgi:hypothetical protein